MAKNENTIEELQAALWYLDQYGTLTEAAKVAGIPRKTLSDRVQKAEQHGLVAAPPAKRSPEAEIKALRQQLAAAQKAEDTAETIRTQIYNLAAETPKPPKWVIDTKAAASSGIPMTLWSDWHWGEVVKKKEVGGVNEFNLEIAHRRLKSLTTKTIDLCINHMTKPQYPGIVICLGGDMISGDIHEELQDTNDDYTQVVLRDLEDHLIAALTTMANQFGRVFVPCVVGNHGRMTKRPRMKGRVFTSFEWNLYCHLERWFRNDDRLQFYIPSETDAYFKVYNHRFLLTHGDSLGVKGGDGIIGALGPIMRGSIKTGRSEAQIGREFDTILMGHWHQYIPLPGIIVNGTLKGYDEFARLALRAKYERPSQALWFLHEKHGITAQWPVYLESLKQSTKKSEWVSWPGGQ